MYCKLARLQLGKWYRQDPAVAEMMTAEVPPCGAQGGMSAELSDAGRHLSSTHAPHVSTWYVDYAVLHDSCRAILGDCDVV